MARARDLDAWPGVASPTVDFGHIKGHSSTSHPTVNPTGIVPAGLVTDWGAPTLRAKGTLHA